MNIIFIHQNFPGQFRHIAAHMAANGHQVVSICQAYAPQLAGIRSQIYQPKRLTEKGVHPYLASTQQQIYNGQGVARSLLTLKQQGFKPDLIVAHAGWGEALYIKQIFPQVPLIGFFEFYYHAEGKDAGFDPAHPLSLDDKLRIQTRNATHLLSLAEVDAGVSPTEWQRSVFPVEYRSKLIKLHEGIDTEVAIADPHATLTLAYGLVLSRQDPVVTYVARNLEPYRGFPQFMRAAERILASHPKAHILVVGGDDVSYGARLPNQQTYRQTLLQTFQQDTSRLHFLGRIPYQQYLKVLQVSSCHLYLTVPFVLSWSLLEAMSAECVIVASDTAPVSEVVQHQHNGLLVDFFDTNALADTALNVLNNRQNYAKLGLNARHTVTERYTLQQGITGYQQLFERMLGAVS